MTGYPWKTGDKLVAEDLNAAFANGSALGGAVLKSGSNMTGPLGLPGNPTTALQATPKQYTDAADALALPKAGGTMTGALTVTANVIAGLSSGASLMRIQGAANSSRSLQYTTSNVLRWQVSAGIASPFETGNNTGSAYRIDAYSDAGSFLNTVFEANRGSGPLNLGNPSVTNLAPFRQINTIACKALGIVGNNIVFGNTADAQPMTTLAANPLAVVNGQPTVTVQWVGACTAAGPISTAVESWVNLSGATAVGGITPTGWLRVQSIVDNDHFTVTWTSNATSTATGGGSSVTVQPSFATTTNWLQSGVKTSGSGFPIQTAELFNIDPSWLQPIGSSGFPRYEQAWKWIVGPNDTSGANLWNITALEWDLTHRGADQGYAPNISAGNNQSVGLWMGAKGGTPPSWTSGGGVGTNWNTVYGVFADLTAGVYDGLNIQPNALVGAAMDPTLHGGVGVDVFGSIMFPAANPFTTANGTSTITVTTQKAAVALQANGNSVWIPSVYTIAGVTFGGNSYVIANVNSTTGTFTITGTGTASSSTAGGGTGQWFAFANLVPYAPYQIWGSFKHGLISTQARFESGGLIETQPGNGFLWNDGTGVASVNSSSVSAGNLNVDITPAGTGKAIVHGQITATNLPQVVTTAGASSVTGTTSETNLAALKVPAGAMGINGTIIITALFSYPNNANNKSLSGRFTGTAGSVSGGSIGSATVVTTSVSAQVMWIVRNNNAANSQLAFISGNAPFGAVGSTAAVITANTVADTWFNINGTLGSSGDTLTLQHAMMTIYPS